MMTAIAKDRHIINNRWKCPVWLPLLVLLVFSFFFLKMFFFFAFYFSYRLFIFIDGDREKKWKKENENKNIASDMRQEIPFHPIKCQENSNRKFRILNAKRIESTVYFISDGYFAVFFFFIEKTKYSLC